MIRLSPPYAPIAQLPALCGPACIAIVVARHGYRADQEAIAQAFDTYVRPTDQHRFQLKHRMAEPTNVSRLGTRFEDLDANFNALAMAQQWPLHAKLFRSSELGDVADFIERGLSQQHDLIVNFWLNEADPRRRGIGHYVVAEAFDRSSRRLTVVDPDPDAPHPRWSIRAEELAQLMLDRWDGKERGIVVIRRR